MNKIFDDFKQKAITMIGEMTNNYGKSIAPFKENI